jgi:uncharacterized protein YegP (UPF0339 family)
LSASQKPKADSNLIKFQNTCSGQEAPDETVCSLERGHNANRDTAKDKWEFYKDNGGEHRWRALSTANGKQVGKATEGFSSKKNAEHNATLNGWKG